MTSTIEENNSVGSLFEEGDPSGLKNVMGTVALQCPSIWRGVLLLLLGVSWGRTYGVILSFRGSFQGSRTLQTASNPMAVGTGQTARKMNHDSWITAE